MFPFSADLSYLMFEFFSPFFLSDDGSTHTL